MKRLMMKRLLSWKNEKNRKPLLLKGVRQVGKTHLLKAFGNQHFTKYRYFNFEKQADLIPLFDKDLDPKRLLNELSFKSGESITIGKDLVIFDEIQQAPKALTSLKYFYEECPNLHLCAAGSLLDLHLSPGSFPVGKVTFETLRPMSFKEFLMAINDKALPLLEKEIPETAHVHLLEMLKHYFIVGGLPESIATYKQHNKPFEAFSHVRKKQDDLLKAYYADIAKHSGKVNAMHIDRVFHSVPAQASKNHNGSIARYKFKGVVPGVSHYNRLAGAIDWLEATGLILKVPITNSGQLPFKAYTKENFFKLLLFDVGILGCMNNLAPKTILDADYGSYKGYFVENYVAQELVCSGQETLISWQEKKAEVEFLLEQDGRAIPIEVKSGTVIKAKSLAIFAEKYHPPLQIILSSCEQKIKGSIHYYPLYLTFLTALRITSGSAG